MKRTLRVVRRDERFHDTYWRTLQDIEERLSRLPPEERYAGAYGVLRGFFGAVLDMCEEAFTVDQKVEMRIILNALDIVTGGNAEQNKQ